MRSVGVASVYKYAVVLECGTEVARYSYGGKVCLPRYSVGLRARCRKARRDRERKRERGRERREGVFAVEAVRPFVATVVSRRGRPCCGLSSFGRRKGAGQFTGGPLVIRGEGPQGGSVHGSTTYCRLSWDGAVGGRWTVGYWHFWGGGATIWTMECPERELEPRRGILSVTATRHRLCRYLFTLPGFIFENRLPTNTYLGTYTSPLLALEGTYLPGYGSVSYMCGLWGSQLPSPQPRLSTWT